MRKLLAIWAAKASAIAGRLMGKKSSSTPGTIAMKICPDIIKILSKNIKKGIVVTCGTNGKTTTNNLLNSALIKCGYTTVCNNLGANMISGVANALVLSCNLLGNLSADYGVFEIDEAYARRVFAHIKPDFMVITNLFRDQLDRYGEIETTSALIDEAISMADGVKLILNGDDPLTTQFGEGRDARYFGISEQVLPQSDEAMRGHFCAKCGCEQLYNYFHYSQLGDYYCKGCGNARPKIDFDATEVDLSGSMKFSVNKAVKIDVNYRGFYNIYNILAVYSALSVMGVNTEGFNEILSDYKPQAGRMELFNIGKPVILNLAKNPAGFNQAIQTVMLDKRKKDVIIAVNDAPSDGQDLSWIWDVDFEGLKDNNLNTLSVSGVRLYDLALRFKYSGISPDNISQNIKNLIERALKTDAEVCYVLVNYTMLFSTQETLIDMEKKTDGGGAEK